MSIALRIRLIFSMLCVMFIGFGIVGVNSLDTLSGVTTKMYNHPFVVSNSVREIQYRVTALDNLLKKIVLAKDMDEIQSTVGQMYLHEQKVLFAFDLIEERFLGDRSDVIKARKSFSNWPSIRQRAVELMAQDKRAHARAFIFEHENSHLMAVKADISGLLGFANNKAIELMKSANVQRDKSVNIYWVMITISISIILIVGVMMVRSMVQPITGLTQRLKILEQGDISGELFESNRSDEIGLIANAVDGLQRTSRRISEQVERVAAGDLSVLIQPRSEKDLLGQSLSSLVHSLKQSAELGDAINRLNTVMRGNPSVALLCEKIIHFICRQIGAVAGCMYVFREGNIVRSASFALARNDSSALVFRPGEGLVGEAAVQKKPLHFDNIPDDYMRIESASGTASVKSLSVIPIIYNNDVLALLEFGTLTVFPKEDLDFINSVSIAIAVSLDAAISRDVLFRESTNVA